MPAAAGAGRVTSCVPVGGMQVVSRGGRGGGVGGRVTSCVPVGACKSSVGAGGVAVWAAGDELCTPLGHTSRQSGRAGWRCGRVGDGPPHLGIQAAAGRGHPPAGPRSPAMPAGHLPTARPRSPSRPGRPDRGGPARSAPYSRAGRPGRNGSCPGSGPDRPAPATGPASSRTHPFRCRSARRRRRPDRGAVRPPRHRCVKEPSWTSAVTSRSTPRSTSPLVRSRDRRRPP